MRHTTTLVVVVMMTLMASTMRALAADPPPLDRATAAKLLGVLSFTDITVLAIVQGPSTGVEKDFLGIGGPNTAMVVANATSPLLQTGADKDLLSSPW